MERKYQVLLRGPNKVIIGDSTSPMVAAVGGMERRVDDIEYGFHYRRRLELDEEDSNEVFQDTDHRDHPQFASARLLPTGGPGLPGNSFPASPKFVAVKSGQAPGHLPFPRSADADRHVPAPANPQGTTGSAFQNLIRHKYDHLSRFQEKDDGALEQFRGGHPPVPFAVDGDDTLNSLISSLKARLVTLDRFSAEHSGADYGMGVPSVYSTKNSVSIHVPPPIQSVKGPIPQPPVIQAPLPAGITPVRGEATRVIAGVPSVGVYAGAPASQVVDAAAPQQHYAHPPAGLDDSVEEDVQSFRNQFLRAQAEAFRKLGGEAEGAEPAGSDGDLMYAQQQQRQQQQQASVQTQATHPPVAAAGTSTATTTAAASPPRKMRLPRGVPASPLPREGAEEDARGADERADDAEREEWQRMKEKVAQLRTTLEDAVRQGEGAAAPAEEQEEAEAAPAAESATPQPEGTQRTPGRGGSASAKRPPQRPHPRVYETDEAIGVLLNLALEKTEKRYRTRKAALKRGQLT